MPRWIESQPRWRNPVWLKDPKINVSSVRISLVYGDPATILRDPILAVRHRRPVRALRLTVAIKPGQLRIGTGFPCLCNQNLRSRDAENCTVHDTGKQHFIAQNVRLTAQNVDPMV